MERFPLSFLKLKKLGWKNNFECGTLISKNCSQSASYPKHQIFVLLGSSFYDVSTIDSFIKVTQLDLLKLKELLI